jgi:hypothetical membrane protein
MADRRLAGLALFVLAAQFLTVIMLTASMAPGYDISAGAISDLGVIPETAVLFNASLIAVGVLNVMGGYLYYRSHGRGWVLALFVLAGAGAAGAGLVPLDRGEAHSLFALAAFVFFNLQAVAVGWAVLRGWMKPLSLLAGLMGLTFVVLMLIGDGGNPAAFGPIGHGATERMIVYPAMLWLMALGGSLMAAEDARPERLGWRRLH